MIDSNLHYLNSFFLQANIQILIASVSARLCPAEEMGLEYSRELEKDCSADFDYLININPKVLKVLSPDEKVRIYEILRLFSLTEVSSTWKYLLEDYSNLLRKRGFKHERYLYLTSLNDAFFAYEFDCKLTKDTSTRRNFFRKFNSKYLNNTLSLEEFLLKYFRLTIVRIRKKQPKRLQRHKGYRDRGSLGTTDRELNEDIKSDCWLEEKRIQRKKQSEDFIEFLLSVIY